MFSDARDAVLAPYVGRGADTFWSILDEYRAVVGGMGALAFFLRDNSLLPLCLDIYVTDRHVRPLEWILTDMEEMDLELVAEVNTFDDLPKHVYRACIFLAPSGKYVRLCWSMSDSVLLPIASSPTTALMNFVGSVTFGCAYPTLTLARRGFRRGSSALSAFDQQQVNNVANNADFVLLNRPRGTATSTTSYPCTRTSFTCPDQARFFGDRGSVVQAFQPPYDNPETLRKEYRAPYGIAVVWCFSPSTTHCEGGCAEKDPILPKDVMALSTVIIGNGVQMRNTVPGARSFYIDHKP